MRHDTVQLLDENTGKTFFDINQTNVFFRSVSQDNRTKSKNKQWYLIKHKLLHNKGNHKQNTKQPIN